MLWRQCEGSRPGLPSDGELPPDPLPMLLVDTNPQTIPLGGSVQ